MTAKHKVFPRGYEFCNFEGQPEEKLIQFGSPASVTIPLQQGFGNEVIPLVEPNQKVLAGQIIGRDDESVSSPVHSPVNGNVVKIEKINTHGRETTAIFIDSHDSGEYQLIYLSGASACGDAGIPTGFKSSVITPQEVEDVIIQGIGGQIHNISLHVLLKDKRLHHFVDGLKILKKLMPGARFHLAFDKQNRDIVKDVCQMLQGNDWIDVFTTAAKYPVHRDELLMPLLLGKAFPHGYSAANAGVIVLDTQAILHVYDAVVKGQPVIERTVALCGPCFEENIHINAVVGSPLSDLVADNVIDSPRFVLNSSLTGVYLSDLSLPLDRTFSTIVTLTEDNQSQFLAFARPGPTKDSYSRTFFSSLFKKHNTLFKKKCGTNVNGELRPCVFCSFCEDVCPAGIIPHLLFHYVENDTIDETLLKYKIFNCIDCNLCSYVCPSKIPVAQLIKDGKAKLIEEGLEPPVPKIALKGVDRHKSLK